METPDTAMTEPRPRTVELIRRLVGFDTVSHKSNLALIEFVRDYLADLGVDSRLIHDETGKKANLYATLGPTHKSGLMLSGHTDVVPVEDQDWTSDPFIVTERDGKLFGRGTCDMKSFIAVVLALAPEFLRRDIKVPVHLAFTFDEEVGCFGARRLVEQLEHSPVRPACCVVGEPTGMKAVNGHKGKIGVHCRVRGLEGHSAYVDKAVNAVEAAAELVAFLKAMARRLKKEGPHDENFDPPYTTVHTGLIQGGTALNIVPRDCSFDFEIRNLPNRDPGDLLAELKTFAEKALLPEMQAVSKEAGFTWDERSDIPALAPVDASEILKLAMSLTGDNKPGRISFGTEAGLYQRASIPTIVCGPGDIAQAHKPDEYIAIGQVARCEAFLKSLVNRLCEG